MGFGIKKKTKDEEYKPIEQKRVGIGGELPELPQVPQMPEADNLTEAVLTMPEIQYKVEVIATLVEIYQELQELKAQFNELITELKK